MARKRIHWLDLLGLFAILLLAVASRCVNLSHNSLWTDEFLSMECSSGWGRYDLMISGTAAPVSDFIHLKNARPLTSIWSSIASDENHPPLYFLLLRMWRDLFGDSPAAIRSLSVVASTVAIALLFAVGTVVHGPRAALWACLLMALSIPEIQQSQDARAYMPMTAVCLGAALALVLIERSGSTFPRCIALCLCAVAAPLLHYMAFATVAAMLIYAVFFMRGLPRRAVLCSLASALAIYAFIWGPQMLSQHIRMIDATAWLVVEQTHHVESAFKNLCTLPSRLFLDLDFDADNAPLASIGACALLLPLFFVRSRPWLMLWWIWLVVPMTVVLLIDVCLCRRSMALVKYILASAPAAYLILGMLAAELRRTGWIPAAVIALCCTICLPGSYTSRQPDWREISKTISQRTRPGDPVVFVHSRLNVFDSGRLMSVCYYLPQKHPLFVIDRPAAPSMMLTLAGTRHACVISDTIGGLARPLISGLSLDHVECLYPMALFGLVDPPKSAVKIARATDAPQQLLPKPSHRSAS